MNLRKVFGVAFLFALILPCMAEAGLSPDIMKDKYLMELSDHLKHERFNEALPYFDKLRALKTRHKLKLPASLTYFEGEALFHTGYYFKADDLLTTYVNSRGKQAKFYNQALELLIVLDTKKEEQRRAERANKEKRRIAAEHERDRQLAMKKDQERAASAAAKLKQRQQDELAKLPAGTLADGFVLVPSGSFQMGGPSRLFTPISGIHNNSNQDDRIFGVKPILVAGPIMVGVVSSSKSTNQERTSVTVSGSRGAEPRSLGSKMLFYSRPAQTPSYDKPMHKVALKTFAMGKYEVTFDQYDAFCKEKKWSCGSPDDQGWGHGSMPVMNVSWKNATAYAKWFSKKHKKKFRLPSEAEWEYAARAGTSSTWSWGNSEALADEYAWYFNNASRQAHEVGQKKPNAFGLYDMHGNIGEWALDCWNPNYIGAPNNEKAWRRGDCKLHVIRGGSYDTFLSAISSSHRHRFNSKKKTPYLGFRLVQEL